MDSNIFNMIIDKQREWADEYYRKRAVYKLEKGRKEKERVKEKKIILNKLILTT
jgi:hypothetical protein